MIKISARIPLTNAEWEKLKKRLGTKTNQEAVANMVNNQLQRWSLSDTDLRIRLKRLSDKVQREIKGEE